jgi:DNA-binding transcriptional LysR family regulator
MTLTTLDLDTLRTLVTATDLGGYGQAAVHLGRTPSAISLQMKRLQADLGSRLFRKHGRGLALTEDGEVVLRYARRMLELNDELVDTVRGASIAGTISLGCAQDFAETVLPIVLSRFTSLYPLVQMEVRIEGNAVLAEAVEQGTLDLALAVGQADRPTARTLGAVDLVWIAGREFQRRPGQALPLVLLGPQCVFRKEATRRLDEAGIAWRVAAVSPSLSGLWASAIGGLGITARSAPGLPAALRSGKTMFGLPALGSFPVTLHTRPSSRSVGVARLDALVTEVVSQALPAVRSTAARSAAARGTRRSPTLAARSQSSTASPQARRRRA